MTLRELEGRSSRPLAHPDTSTIFVMGLLSIFFFPLGIAAWIFGTRLLRKYDAEPGRWAHRGWVKAGRILGLVGIGVGVLVLIALLVT